MNNFLNQIQARLSQEKGIDRPPLPQAVPDNKPMLPDVEAQRRIRVGIKEATENPTVARELRRICSLPVRGDLSAEESAAMSKMLVQAEAYLRGDRLFDCQSASVLAFKIVNGLLGPIGVGWGKTLITLLCAQAYYDQGKRYIMLVVPAQVIPQLTTRDFKMARRFVNFSLPTHVLGGKTLAQRKHICNMRRPGLYVMSSALFSRPDICKDPDTEEPGMLEIIAPDLIIIDEAHEFKRRDSARTRRLMGYVSEHQPKGICLSGTLTNKSVLDYHHLATWCLGENSPLPLDPSIARQWGAVIDSKAAPTRSMMLSMRPLIDWARQMFPGETFTFDKTGFRKAFRHRLVTSPGVVATGDQDIGVSLTLVNHEVEGQGEGWSDLETLFEQVQNEWVTPSGDEIDHAIHAHKWLKELSAGFYNNLVWPSGDKIAKRHDIEVKEADDLITKAQEYHSCLQYYHKVLREWIHERATPGLDTPFTIGSNMAKYGHRDVGGHLFSAWSRMRALREAAIPPWNQDKTGKNRKPIERDSIAVRVCPWKIDKAIELVRSLKKSKKESVLVWYLHVEIGEWLTEKFREAGFETAHFPASDEAARTIILPEFCEGKVCVASINAHGTGKNMQHFQKTVVVEWPREAPKAQQMLGRNHRNGQEADHLDIHTLVSTTHEQENFSACLIDALYTQQTTGDRHRLVFCGYDPIPELFPPDVLRERGFNDVAALEQPQWRELAEKFKIVS